MCVLSARVQVLPPTTRVPDRHFRMSQINTDGELTRVIHLSLANTDRKERARTLDHTHALLYAHEHSRTCV
eukprot:5098241-Pleurochrysis_carterae.AAC.1